MDIKDRDFGSVKSIKSASPLSMVKHRNNLLQRLITGGVLIIVVSLAVLLSEYSFYALVYAIDLLSILEFYRLFASNGFKSRKIAGIFLSTCIFFSFLFLHFTGNVTILLMPIPVAFGLFIEELYLKEEQPFQILAFTFLGVICITLPLSFFIYCSFTKPVQGLYLPKIMLGYFLLLWASDSGAYLAGKKFGHHKLFERISPGKTWEGALGGLIFALLVAAIEGIYFKELPFISWFIIALIIVAFGIYSDLIKSLLKRSLHVKDSGTILPGHGGMLDRFDTLLGSAPFVFSYLILFR